MCVWFCLEMRMCGCPQVYAVGEWWRTVTLCSGFSLGCGYKSLGCHVFLWSASSLSSRKPQRAMQRETERFKGWQQHHGLEVLSLPLTVLERGWRGRTEREKGTVGVIAVQSTSLFFFLCWAGWLADGLVTSKMKMNAVKFACVNFSSLRWDLEHSQTQTSTFIHSHTYHRYTCMHSQWHARPCPAGFNHTPSACGESVSVECEASAWLKECVSNVHSHSLCCFGM